MNPKTGLSLLVIYNHKLNKYIEDLCELCGFNTPITKVCYRAGARVEETFPKYELLGTHTGRTLISQKRPKPMREYLREGAEEWLNSANLIIFQEFIP